MFVLAVLGVQSVLKPAIFKTVDVAIEMGPVYSVDSSVGALPSVV